MMDQYDAFLKNAKELQDAFGIVPLLYGSLGLEVLTHTSLHVDDIDILIPSAYVSGKEWAAFQRFLTERGYVLTDVKEHTFTKDGVAFSYAEIEELKDFAGIDRKDIKLLVDRGVRYLLLSLEQYRKVYQKSSQDGYRIHKKEKQDHAKLQLITEQIRKKIV